MAGELQPPRATVVTKESNFAVKFLREKYPQLNVQQAEHAPNHAFHQVRRCPQTKPIRFITVGAMEFRK